MCLLFIHMLDDRRDGSHMIRGTLTFARFSLPFYPPAHGICVSQREGQHHHFCMCFTLQFSSVRHHWADLFQTPFVFVTVFGCSTAASAYYGDYSSYLD